MGIDMSISKGILPTEKLQKVIANTGKASRRVAEKWIEEGRVQVNGELAKLGRRVTAKDSIRIDNVLLKKSPDSASVSTQVLLYHKPLGEICTREDPEGRPTVFSRLPALEHGRWIMVGRLDINTSGLLLFTTDGELANQLMHPRHEVLRTYMARIQGNVSPETLRKLKKGMPLEDGMARFHRIQLGSRLSQGKNNWYKVSVGEGRNRLVRRLWETTGYTVNRLMRIAYGNVVLPRDLASGQHRELTSKEIEALRSLVNTPSSQERKNP